MFFEYKKTPIYYSIAGHGLPILLLHGFLESSLMWDIFIPPLSKKNTIITMDFPGHGKSQCLTETYSMEVMAEIVNCLLIHLNFSKISIVGHSMGGYISLAFLENYSTKINQITLLNSTTEADSIEKKTIRNRAIKVIQSNKEAFINMAIGNLFSEKNNIQLQQQIQDLKKEANTFPLSGIIGALNAMRDRKDRTKILKKFSGNKNFIAATKDNLIPFSTSKRIAKHCKTRLITVQGGHMSTIENPLRVIKILLLNR